MPLQTEGEDGALGEGALPELEKKRRRRRKKDALPKKRTMNLYFKPDRTTRPATAALYSLFAATVLLGLSKSLVYDLWMEAREAEQACRSAQRRLEEVSSGLKEYDKVKLDYIRYAATDEELTLVDRMVLLGLLENTVGAVAEPDSIAISGSRIACPFQGVTLAQAAGIVQELEASELVRRVTVSTASSAGTDRPAGKDDLVSADMVVELIEKELPEKAGAPEAAPGTAAEAAAGGEGVQ